MTSQQLLLKALNKEPLERPPVWLMRQAGRYMHAYQEVRSKNAFLDLCHNPDLASKVTLDAARILDTDAAIIFADILLILEALGENLTFEKGHGPRLEPTIFDGRMPDFGRQKDAINNLEYVFQAINITRKDLPKHKSLLGFAGSPFTVLTYLIEGGKAGSSPRSPQFIQEHPKAFDSWMTLLTDVSIDYLSRQFDAGADAVQVFDTWAGILSEGTYVTHVKPHLQRLFGGIAKKGPTIYFARHASHLLDHFPALGTTGIGLDETMELLDTRERLEYMPIQGNLDPRVLLEERPKIRAAAYALLEKTQGLEGYIFNLGHGVLPETDEDNVKYLVDLIHGFERQIV